MNVIKIGIRLKRKRVAIETKTIFSETYLGVGAFDPLLVQNIC